MKTNIPIHRAKKIDSDEYVEGYLYPDLINKNKWYIFQINEPSVEIGASTLAISTDGINWFSIENLNHILTSQEVVGIQQ